MIFVDLDECLIRTEYGETGVDDYDRRFIVRPGALTLLTSLRSLGPTKMLTAGIRMYARQINKLHSFGFDTVDILAREDFCKSPIYFEPILHTRDYCPNSVLIDNHPAGNEFTDAKLEFLGIKSDRLITVPHFTHYPDKFEDMIPEITERVRKLITHE